MVVFILLIIVILTLLYNFFIYYHIILVMLLVVPLFIVSGLKSLPKLHSTLGILIYWGYSYLVIIILFNNMDILLISTFFNELFYFVNTTYIISFLNY